jgi:hypothetical protein
LNAQLVLLLGGVARLVPQRPRGPVCLAFFAHLLCLAIPLYSPGPAGRSGSAQSFPVAAFTAIVLTTSPTFARSKLSSPLPHPIGERAHAACAAGVADEAL